MQNRKFYKGYFYGDQMYKLNITGRPRLFKGFSAQNMIIYADFTAEIKDPACPGNSYSNVFVYVARFERPD